MDSYSNNTWCQRNGYRPCRLNLRNYDSLRLPDKPIHMAHFRIACMELADDEFEVHPLVLQNIDQCESSAFHVRVLLRFYQQPEYCFQRHMQLRKNYIQHRNSDRSPFPMHILYIHKADTGMLTLPVFLHADVLEILPVNVIEQYHGLPSHDVLV